MYDHTQHTWALAAKQLIWVTNFDLPVANNVGERALRGYKTRMKVSGQFLAAESASNYAVIKTYLETCVRNGINEVDALIHLCVGAPYSVGDLLGVGSREQLRGNLKKALAIFDNSCILYP